MGLSAKVSKGQSYITKRLSLLKLLDKGKKLFLAGKITEGHAMLVSRLQPADQKMAIEHIERDDPSIQALRDWIESELMLDLSKVSFSKTDSQLVPKAGTCIECPKRTGTSKDLFDDVKQGDRCTDGACFKLKMQAHIEQLENSLKGAGHKVYALWESYHSEKTPEGVLKVGVWTEIKKKDFCENAAKGIFLERERAGQYADICADREHCKIHGHQSIISLKTPAEREKTRKENRKADETKEVRTRVFKALFESKVPVRIKELHTVASFAFERLWHDMKGQFVKALDWKPEEKKKKEYGSDWSHVEIRISKMSVDEVHRFLLALALAKDLDPRFHNGDDIRKCAENYGIKVAEIVKAVHDEFEKKAKKVPKEKAEKKPNGKPKGAAAKSRPKPEAVGKRK